MGRTDDAGRRLALFRIGYHMATGTDFGGDVFQRQVAAQRGGAQVCAKCFQSLPDRIRLGGEDQVAGDLGVSRFQKMQIWVLETP